MLPRLASLFAVFFLSFPLFAAEPPAADASVETLAKDSWLRDQVVANYKKCWDKRFEGEFAKSYSMGMMELIVDYENLTPAYFESVARDEGWEVYLIAYEEIPVGLDVLTPNKNRKEKAQFWMFVEGLGKEAFLRRLKDLKTTPEQNLKNLEKCGFLTIKKRAKSAKA